jgi:hypothetical protein
MYKSSQDMLLGLACTRLVKSETMPMHCLLSFPCRILQEELLAGKRKYIDAFTGRPEKLKDPPPPPPLPLQHVYFGGDGS